MNMIRFTPTQLTQLAELRADAGAAAPDWAELHRRATSMQRRLLPGGERVCEAVEGQEWAVSRLLEVLDRCAATLRPMRRSA